LFYASNCLLRLAFNLILIHDFSPVAADVEFLVLINLYR
jgi:hypothetical protein